MRIEKHKTINYFIASIWLINGLLCKILNLVPRHKLIISEITHTQYEQSLTITIGLLEILMALWIICKIKTKFNAIVQIIIITTMNVLEFILVPDLLLWGKFNSLFALILILIISYNEFVLNSNTNKYYAITP